MKVEDTELIEQVGDEYHIRINKMPKPNDDVKPIGADLKAGDLLIEPNSELTAASFALLASVNHSRVRVYEKPKISILSTGDELLVAGDAYRLPCIYDSNRTLLKNLLASKNYTALCDLGIANDELNSLYHKLLDAFEQSGNCFRMFLNAFAWFRMLSNISSNVLDGFDYLRMVRGVEIQFFCLLY